MSFKCTSWSCYKVYLTYIYQDLHIKSVIAQKRWFYSYMESINLLNAWLYHVSMEMVFFSCHNILCICWMTSDLTKMSKFIKCELRVRCYLLQIGENNRSLKQKETVSQYCRYGHQMPTAIHTMLPQSPCQQTNYYWIEIVTLQTS